MEPQQAQRVWLVAAIDQALCGERSHEESGNHGAAERERGRIDAWLRFGEAFGLLDLDDPETARWLDGTSVDR